jgi:hypothetical protein
MLVVSFPGGGHLSIEFTDDAPDDEQPRLDAWLELRADGPAAVLYAAIEAGLTYQGQAPGPSALLHDSWRPSVHHRPSELNRGRRNGLSASRWRLVLVKQGVAGGGFDTRAGVAHHPVG